MGLASKLQATGGGGGGVAQASAPPAPQGYGAPQQQQANFFPGTQGGFPGSQQQGAPSGAPAGYPQVGGQAPGMGQPGTGQPGMGQPGMGQPGMGQAPRPGMGAPGMGQPGMGQPGMGQPQSGFPGQQQQQGYPGQQPGMGQQQGFGQPGMGQPGMQPQQGHGQQQQGMPGAQPGQQSSLIGGPGANNPASMQALQQKLQSIIQANRLDAFYPPGSPQLQTVLNRLGRVDFKALGQKWNMPQELAYDLASLALYDVVIYADDSGSMVFEENGERIQDLKLILGKVAEVATLFDDDGILIRFMNNNTQGNGIRDSASAAALIQQINFSGMTPLGTNLMNKVIQPFLQGQLQQGTLQKPILVIVITDGEPVGEPANTVQQTIRQAKGMVSNSRYGPGAIAFEFAQVGKDQKAQAFLATLDNDPELGRMIDATSYYELEADEYARKGVTLTPELWLVKLMVGAVDPTYDEQD